MYNIPDKMLRSVSEAAANLSESAASQQAEIHRQVGVLIAVWGNVESNMLHLVERLLNTTADNAILTYYSFGAMRAREAYILALAENNLSGENLLHARKILKTFKNLTRTRNELVHSEYMLDPSDYSYEATNYPSVDSVTHKVKHTKRPLNKSRLNEMRDVVRKLHQNGVDLLILCSRIDEARTSGAPPSFLLFPEN